MGSVLIFGLSGIVLHASEPAAAAYMKDELYIEECGACHLAYPPNLLPSAGWQAMLDQLAEHFGENAEMDDETDDHIRSYLEANGLKPGEPSTVSQLLRNLPQTVPLRITDLPAFVVAHDPVLESMQVETVGVGFFSPCADCHREALDGLFDKELLHPGYGPSTWGRQQ